MRSSAVNTFSNNNTRIFLKPDDFGAGGFSDEIFQEVKADETSLGKIADPSLALVMGCIWAGRRAPLRTNTIEFYSPQIPILEMLKDNLVRHFPQSTPKIYPPETPKTNRLTIHSRPLARIFNFHTNGAEDLPWHLMETRDEKLAFLRGMYLFSGSMNSAGVTLGVSLGKRAAVQIARLLASVGVVPGIEEVNGLSRVTIRDDYSLRKFHDHQLFIDKVKQRILKDHCDKKTGRVSIDPAKYHEFKEHFLMVPKKSIEQIARDISVPATTLRYWQSGNAPRTITRERALNELINKISLPDPGTMTYCYRQLNYPLPVSLEIAGKISESKLHKLLKLSEVLNWGAKPDSRFLYDLNERLGELLTDMLDVKHKVKDGKLDNEFARRTRLIEWAATKGVRANTFTDLLGKLVDAYHPLFQPVIRIMHKRLQLSSYGMSLEDSEQVAKITSFECLSRTFEPSGTASYKTYGSAAIKNRLYSEYGRVSKAGHRVVFIAKSLLASKENIPVEEIMSKYNCSKVTAAHAQGLARSNAAVLEVSADNSDDETPYSSYLKSNEKDPSAQVETEELFSTVIKLADPKVKAIIKLVYSDGLGTEKAAKTLEMNEADLKVILETFFMKVRKEHPGL